LRSNIYKGIVLEAESKKRRGVSLFLIFLVLSLIHFVSTAFIFHAGDVKTAEYYSAEWFLENSNAMKPKFPFFNWTLPSINYTPEYLFEVRGDSRGYAWRFFVLSRYVEGYGWVIGDLNVESYSVNASGNTSFLIKIVPLPIDVLRGFPLIALWDVSQQGVIISALAPYVSTVSRFEYMTSICRPDDILVLNVSSDEQGMIGFEYATYYVPIDMVGITNSFSSVLETNTTAWEDTTLRYYLSIPQDYFVRYPEVYDFIRNITLPSDVSVYSQATYALAYLFSNYDVKEDILVVHDPVANFIKNGGGSPTGFVNVTAFILRALGIPTRVIIGFFGGRYYESFGITRYTFDDFVAWVEIWDKNIGWIPLWAYPFVTKIYNSLSPIAMEISTPREIAGFPAARLEDTVTININLRGAFEPLEGAYVEIYDLNESALIGIARIEQIDNDLYQCTFGFKYSGVYNELGKSATYGRHIIMAKIGSLYLTSELILLRATIIG